MLLCCVDYLKRNSKMKNNEQHIMPFIERLLDGAEVEWKPLGDVVLLEKGKQLNKQALSDKGAYPAYNGGVSFSGFTDLCNYSANKIIISQGGASAGFVNFVTTDFYANAHCYVVLPDETQVVNRYVFHFLKLNQEVLMGKQLGAGIPALRTNEILNLSIPIPCPTDTKKSLEIQRKLVEILDKFTELEAELEAELDCRKRQYEYYRNKLLAFDMLNTPPEKLNSINWLTIKDISKNISSGGTPRSNNATYYGGDIPWLRTQEVNFSDIWDTEVKITKEGMDASSAKYIPANCVIIAMYGATVGRVGINKIPLTTNQACANIEVDENIALYRYVFHYLSSQYEYIRSLGAGSQTNINARIVKGLKIPIPPLSEQQRIVSFLDKFDTLTSSISEGLPKEIELRRKQYEYYREQLLSFRH